MHNGTNHNITLQLNVTYVATSYDEFLRFYAQEMFGEINEPCNSEMAMVFDGSANEVSAESLAAIRGT